MIFLGTQSGNLAIESSPCQKALPTLRVRSLSRGRARFPYRSCYQREMVRLSRYRVADPFEPRPSTWKLETNVPAAQPSVKSEFTVALMGDSTPSNHTDS